MSFEFSETYLTSLWDSLHNTVFDTFSFDSDRVRHLMINQVQQDEECPMLISRSVWDWSSQFHDVDIGLFLNPLFSVTCRVGAYRQRRGIPTTSVARYQPVGRWIASPPQNDRPRRNSISGSMTLPRTEYGAAEQNSGTDTLGRSWGSRFGLAALTEQGAALNRINNDSGGGGGGGGSGGSSRWKKLRGALFHSHGRSFSPSSHQISSIEEGMEPMVSIDVF